MIDWKYVNFFVTKFKKILLELIAMTVIVIYTSCMDMELKVEDSMWGRTSEL